MCGIHVSITRTPSADHALSPELTRCLRARGPDHFGQVDRCLQRPRPRPEADDLDERTATSRATAWWLRFTSTVLALRGDHVARQPLLAEPAGSGSVLCWNGEAWRLGGERVRGNDGEAILARLMMTAGAAGAGPGGERVDAVLDVLRDIEGPFAFVFYDAVAGTVFFGRDRLGRQSLLLAPTSDGGLELCSIAGAADQGWQEVEADGVYVLTLGKEARPERHDWVVGDDAADFVSGIGRFNRALPAGHHQLTGNSTSVVSLKEQLLESLRLRILDIPLPPAGVANCNTRVAILFSGGLDCTVLARLCHELLEPDQGIDLLNVGFENPRVIAQLQKEKRHLPDFYEACPDRITGRKSFSELQKVCPGRAFRFVAAHRQQVISLIHPHNTEMDLSIACALYFAARSQGLCTEQPDSVPISYTSPARVLLSGLGADELFGGYSRHPSAFQQRGYPGLIDELLLDVSRLGKRNLGRDNRVMAHWSKEVRFPFLDERLVSWAIETPAWEKCDFENGEEIGGVEAGKRILRLLALKLGMENVAAEKKRAIQFGSRTAKMESGKVKGTTLIS
ncbi:asparagine synthase-domain-containing protein [Corynascus similis CBS 632.67]